MAKKCELCKEKIEDTFLQKFKGTTVKGKYVCSSCQKKHQDKLKEMVK
ncbi:MAG: hypothetical protein ABIB71_02250 [Candidatus Woesearchaeota archaeon]